MGANPSTLQIKVKRLPTKLFKLSKPLQHKYVVSLSFRLDGAGQTGEPRADDDDFYAG